MPKPRNLGPLALPSPIFIVSGRRSLRHERLYMKILVWDLRIEIAAGTVPGAIAPGRPDATAPGTVPGVTITTRNHTNGEQYADHHHRFSSRRISRHGRRARSQLLRRNARIESVAASRSGLPRTLV